MTNRDKISSVLVRVLNATRLSSMRKVSEAHENCWKEFLNGSISSQTEADRKLAEIAGATIAELDDKTIEYIISVLEK